MALSRLLPAPRHLPSLFVEPLVQSGRAMRAVLGLILFLILGGIWLLMPHQLGRGAPKIAFTLLLWGFGIQVRHQGHVPEKGELCVANHVSWTDIPVLGVTIGAAFVAKSDVRQWPIIGPLAARYGCLFIARDRRATTRAQADALAALLADRNIILFPEGTTGDGQRLLPFRSSLIAAVAGQQGRILPVTLAYRWADGRALGDVGWDICAWVGDADLLTHASRVALAPPICVDVLIGTGIENTCRKTLAATASRVISTTLGIDAEA